MLQKYKLFIENNKSTTKSSANCFFNTQLYIIYRLFDKESLSLTNKRDKNY